MSAALNSAVASSEMPVGLSAKQQKLFELRMRMNQGRKANHMEVAAEKRRAQDPIGEAKRQREMADERAEKRKKTMEDAVSVDLESYKKAKEEDPEFYRDANSLAFGQQGYQPKQDKVENMVNELLDKAEKRNNFSRRRADNEEAGVDYINDRNKHFNKKIERAFGDYTKVIKENLERGTAI